MKLIYKSLVVLLAVFVAGGFLLSCSDDDSGGKPLVRYIRVTKPSAADSLVVSAGQGQMVVIMGENLQGVREVWFNDRPATLNVSFITDRSVITRVPSQIPNVITNEMKMVFDNGEMLIYDFTTDISEPRVDRLKSEYVPIGQDAIFYGNYFYEPITVTFAGGVEGEVTLLEDEEMHVKVPEGAEPGPVTVTTNFGETVTNFWLNDNRNIIASFDGTTNGLWHGPAFIKATDPAIPNINGKFIRLKNNLGAWAWFELYVGPVDSDVALETKNIPQEAFAKPSDYSVKFELNTLAPLTGAHIRMYFGPDMGGERGAKYYNWQPNIHTNGAWETVSIPFEDFWEANGKFAYNPNGYGVSIHFSGPNAVNADFALDNMRIVPNTID